MSRTCRIGCDLDSPIEGQSDASHGGAETAAARSQCGNCSAAGGEGGAELGMDSSEAAASRERLARALRAKLAANS
jgi:hypothetical protein